MKKTFKKLSADAGKLNVNFTHKYYPIKDDEAYVVVEHIKNTEVMEFLDRDKNVILFEKLFLSKVKEVHGVEITVDDGSVVEATKEDILNISDNDFMKIIYNTCYHLISGSEFTEEESKN